MTSNYVRSTDVVECYYCHRDVMVRNATPLNDIIDDRTGNIQFWCGCDEGIGDDAYDFLHEEPKDEISNDPLKKWIVVSNKEGVIDSFDTKKEAIAVCRRDCNDTRPFRAGIAFLAIQCYQYEDETRTTTRLIGTRATLTEQGFGEAINAYEFIHFPRIAINPEHCGISKPGVDGPYVVRRDIRESDPLHGEITLYGRTVPVRRIVGAIPVDDTRWETYRSE